jgi:sucrose-phosphate synthase
VLTPDQIEETYKISRRIEGEERALDAALMVITSTQQEVDMQWGLYDGCKKEVEKVLNSRQISGYAMPFMYVCPPGLDFSSLKVGALNAVLHVFLEPNDVASDDLQSPDSMCA